MRRVSLSPLTVACLLLPLAGCFAWDSQIGKPGPLQFRYGEWVIGDRGNATLPFEMHNEGSLPIQPRYSSLYRAQAVEVNGTNDWPVGVQVRLASRPDHWLTDFPELVIGAHAWLNDSYVVTVAGTVPAHDRVIIETIVEYVVNGRQYVIWAYSSCVSWDGEAPLDHRGPGGLSTCGNLENEDHGRAPEGHYWQPPP